MQAFYHSDAMFTTFLFTLRAYFNVLYAPPQQRCTYAITKSQLSTIHLFLRIMEYLPSKSNFVLAKKAGVSGEELYSKLKEKGVLVRHFGGRIADYIRITVGSKEEINTLIDCLKEIL